MVGASEIGQACRVRIDLRWYGRDGRSVTGRSSHWVAAHARVTPLGSFGAATYCLGDADRSDGPTDPTDRLPGQVPAPSARRSGLAPA